MGYYAGIASAVLWPALMIWRRRGGPNPLDVPRRLAFSMGILWGAMTITGFLALEHIDASVYIVIVYLYPVLVVVGSSMLGHRVTAGVWVALAVVMSGIVLTVPELFGGVGEISVLGVVLTLVQAVLMAAFMIVNSKVMPGHIDGTVSAAWNCLGALVLMTPLAFGSGFHAPETRTVVLEVLLFGLVPAFAATRPDVAPTLKDEAGAISAGGTANWFRRSRSRSRTTRTKATARPEPVASP